MLVFSFFLLLRGHNLPGGGFIGSLVAATAFALYAIAFGPASVRQALRVEPMKLSIAGLGIALVAGLLALLGGRAVPDRRLETRSSWRAAARFRWAAPCCSTWTFIWWCSAPC